MQRLRRLIHNFICLLYTSGSFRTRQRRGRIGRNPKTGAKVEVPPKRIPFFKPSKELKDFVNTSGSPAARAGA